MIATACTGDGDSTASGPTASGRASAGIAGVSLDATLTQSRTDLGTPMINAQLTNTGATSVTVASIELRSPVLARVPPSPKDTTYAPGRIIDLRIPYGRPLCRADALSEASFRLTLDDGSVVTLPLDAHGIGWLNGIYRHDCAVRALSAVARVSFARDGRRVEIGGDQYVSTALIVARPPHASARSPFEVRWLSGSVLLRLLPRTTRELPFTLRPGVRRARLPILIGTFRCGPHEMSASQQTFLLSAYARTPDVHTQRLIIVPPARLRADAQRLLVDVCVG